jgi:putative toxin-antitoxin system antitoxin component (TIGR02293 family)
MASSEPDQSHEAVCEEVPASRIRGDAEPPIEEADIIRRAVEVIGNREYALRWLGTPVRALHYATPISILGSKEGQEAVLTVLGRLEHGIF